MLEKNRRPELVYKLDKRYYFNLWLSCMASLGILAIATLRKHGSFGIGVQATMEWTISWCLINGLFWAAVAAIYARRTNRNWKNAAVGIYSLIILLGAIYSAFNIQ